MKSIPERDWKQLRALQSDKLALACDRVLSAAERIAQQRAGDEHQAFLKLCHEVKQANDTIAQLFDDIRRSNALMTLVGWRHAGLLSDAELALFSEETQEALRHF
jgi:hypothetical protein